MDSTGCYVRLDRNYILRLVFIISLTSGLAISQKTYMRACDCEYIVDGKCAYTLYLPVPTNSAQNTGPTCPKSVTETNTAKEQSMRIESVETTLDLVQSNLSRLRDITAQNARLLLDVQNKVISLQHVVLMNNQTPVVDEKRREEQGLDSNSTFVTQKQHNQILDQVNNQHSQITSLMREMNSVTQSINNVINNYQTLSNNLNTVKNDVNTLKTSNADSMQMLNAQKEEIAYLRSALDMYKYEGVLCKKKGLIVSGGSKYIPDAQINASSMFDLSHGPNRSRVYTQSVPGAWCPCKY